jgi:two-component system response regulator NreC
MPAHLHLAPDPSGCGAQSRRPAVATRVILASARPVVRRSLQVLLDREADVAVIAEAGDLSTAVRHVRSDPPQVLVLDLQTPNGSSIETILRLRDQVPETEVVAVTLDARPSFAQHMLDAGALGFVLMDTADRELSAAVQAAAAGREYISPQLAARLDALRRAIHGDELGPRDRELVRLIALGHTTADIGARLHHSRRSVARRRAHIYRNLGVTTRAELVRYARRRHLLGA